VPEPWELSAREIARKVSGGELTAEAVTRSVLDRIAELETAIQAWQHLDPERTIAEARAIDRGPSRGVLAGVPVGIKDVIDTADMPTTYGSAVYKDFRPRADASCVALMRAAGAVGLGKTVSTEFAILSPGVCASLCGLRVLPGSSGRRGNDTACVRHADLWFDHPTGVVLRRRGLQADLRHDRPYRREDPRKQP